MIDKKNKIEGDTPAVLVGLAHREQTEEQVKEYLDELAFLAETAGAKALKRFFQKLSHPDSKTFVGKGKLEEIKEYVESKEIQLAILKTDIDNKIKNETIAFLEKKYATDSKKLDDLQQLKNSLPSSSSTCLVS